MTNSNSQERLHITISSSSTERMLRMVVLCAQLGISTAVLFRALSAETFGVLEPMVGTSVEVALKYKVLPMAVLLGLIDATDELIAGLDWVPAIVQARDKLDPRILQAVAEISKESHIVYGSDVISIVLAINLSEFIENKPGALAQNIKRKGRELFKLTRQLPREAGSLSPEKYAKLVAQVVSNDFADTEELFFNKETIAVLFDVGLAAWRDGTGVKTEQHQIMAVFEPGAITPEMLEEAYTPETGSAWYSATRLDFAKLVADGKARHVFIKLRDRWQVLPESDYASVVLGLVRGGVADVRIMSELLGVDFTKAKESSDAMLEQFELNVYEPARSFLLQQFREQIRLEHRFLGERIFASLVLPSVRNMGDMYRERSSDDSTRIEVVQIGGKYHIEADGLLLINHHLNMLGMNNTAMLETTKYVLGKFAISCPALSL